MERQDVLAYRKETGFHEKPAWLQERLEWFQDQKFGIILHWAPYALFDCCESWPISPGDEWARAEDMECWTSRERDFARFQRDYWDLNKQFNPVKFAPEEWARLAKLAGARYVSFTTKHHDGFCMWDTATTDYKITGPDCPFHNALRADVFGEVVRAFQNQGMAISAYFSKADWHCPHYWAPDRPVLTRHANTLDDPEEWARFVAYTHAQIREIMSNYGKIDILWLDAGWVKEQEDIDMAGMVAMARELQPGLIVANRTVGDEFEDFVTPEREIPDEPLGEPWEACLVMAENWKYCHRDHYRSVREILDMLVETVAKGGNLVLGIGPNPEGELTPEAVERLEKIGEWMAINGEAIYGTRAVDPHRDGKFWFTGKGSTTYAFVPQAEDFVLRSVASVATVQVLGLEEPVRTCAHDDGLLVCLPAAAADLPKPIVVKLNAERDAEGV